MTDLDFAFLSLIKNDKKGLVYRKVFLDKLAPFLFGPRVNRLIDLPLLDYRGCNVTVPLGPGNFSLIEPIKQEMLLKKSMQVSKGFTAGLIAADRRLKNDFLKLSRGFSLVFGDNFIKALAVVFIKKMLYKKGINRLVIVGETGQFNHFIEIISGYGIPVSIQSTQPSRYEILAYQLLYHQGSAVSTGRLNPYSWEKGDLVIIFDNRVNIITPASTQAFCIYLNNEADCLAPWLEESLKRNGLIPRLYNLAPIMESYLSSCLYREAQLRPENISDENAFVLLEDMGQKISLWELFLKKV